MADREVTTSETVLDLRETYNLTAQDVGDIANLNSTSFTGTPTNVVDAVSALATEGFNIAMAVALG
tara:strand:+ start:336 stop:533 length:198 start_codon:yes stop_codon:yes gene_type:complete